MNIKPGISFLFFFIKDCFSLKTCYASNTMIISYWILLEIIIISTKKKNTCGSLWCLGYLGKYSLSLNLHLFWIMQCKWDRNQDLISYFFLDHFYQMPYFKRESKTCPSWVCPLSDVTLFSFVIIPRAMFLFH